MRSGASSLRTLVTLTGALGFLGAALLTLSYFFLTPGKFILVPFALVVVGIVVAVRAERVEPFRTRFAVCLGAFALASLALYVAVALAVANEAVTFSGHLARIAALLLVGAGVSLATARLARSAGKLPTPNRV